MKNANVLVVDDEPGIRDLLTQELTAQGYDVASAADGWEALEKLEQEIYHVVLCDINMPKLGGLEILRVVRERDPGLAVIMMTGYGTDETAMETVKRGGYAFVQKPFNLDDIFALVEKSLKDRKGYSRPKKKVV